jgi:hypothetical protein
MTSNVAVGILSSIVGVPFLGMLAHWCFKQIKAKFCSHRGGKVDPLAVELPENSNFKETSALLRGSQSIGNQHDDELEEGVVDDLSTLISEKPSSSFTPRASQGRSDWTVSDSEKVLNMQGIQKSIVPKPSLSSNARSRIQDESTEGIDFIPEERA